MYTFFKRQVGLFFLLSFCVVPVLGPGELAAQDRSFVQAGEPPHIETDMKAIDFGEVLAGEVASRKLKIFNKGEGDLDLYKVRFTCGCTIPQIIMPSGEIVVPDKDGEKMIGVLKQNESAELELEFVTLGLYGKVKKSLTIFSNDPQNRELTLLIEAMLKAPFSVQPVRLAMGDIRRGIEVRKKMRIRSIRAGEFKISKINMLPPYLTYETVEVPEAEDPTIDLFFTLTNEAPVGIQNLKLRAEIESERIKEMNLHVSFNVQPPVAFQIDGEVPRETVLDFGVLKYGDGAEKVVDIINDNPEIPYEITDISLITRYSDFIKTKLEVVKPGLHYRILVNVAPEIDARFFRGVIKLTSPHPDLKLKEIPLKGWIAKPPKEE